MRLIKPMYANDSRAFDIGRGMLQGDCLSPVLFICTLDSVLCQVNKEEDSIVTAAGTAVQDLG